jgi:hypothetical protein
MEPLFERSATASPTFVATLSILPLTPVEADSSLRSRFVKLYDSTRFKTPGER